MRLIDLDDMQDVRAAIFAVPNRLDELLPSVRNGNHGLNAAMAGPPLRLSNQLRTDDCREPLSTLLRPFQEPVAARRVAPSEPHPKDDISNGGQGSHADFANGCAQSEA